MAFITGVLIRGIQVGVLCFIWGVTLSTQLLAAEEYQSETSLATDAYISVPYFSVTMYHKGRPKGSMTVKVSLKLQDSDKREAATRFMPRLTNAYVMEANRLSHGYFDVKRPVNVAMLGDALQAVTNRVLHHKDAKILISEVVVNQR